MNDSLFEPCAVPACTQPVATVGDACQTCRAAFGPMLLTEGRQPMTAAEIAERDDTTRRILHARKATTA